MGRYNTAQICLNGHVVSSMADASPEFQKNFCAECGEETIMKCPSCNNFIKGSYEAPGFIGIAEYDRPKFCDNCGKPYPWTDRKANAAKSLVDFTEGLTASEKEDLKKSIDDLIKDSPESTVAQAKFKKYITKVGGVVASGLKELLFDLVSEFVKKSLWNG